MSSIFGLFWFLAFLKCFRHLVILHWEIPGHFLPFTSWFFNLFFQDLWIFEISPPQTDRVQIWTQVFPCPRIRNHPGRFMLILLLYTFIFSIIFHGNLQLWNIIFWCPLNTCSWILYTWTWTGPSCWLGFVMPKTSRDVDLDRPLKACLADLVQGCCISPPRSPVSNGIVALWVFRFNYLKCNIWHYLQECFGPLFSSLFYPYAPNWSGCFLIPVFSLSFLITRSDDDMWLICLLLFVFHSLPTFEMGFGKLGMGIYFYLKFSLRRVGHSQSNCSVVFHVFLNFVFVVENLQPTFCDCLAGRTGTPNFYKIFISLEALCTP